MSLETQIQSLATRIAQEINLSKTSKRFRASTDCVANVNSDNFTFTVSGTGAAFSSLAPRAENAIGILRGALGTVATNRLSIASPQMAILLFGKGTARFIARVRFPTLSDVTNTYTFRAGFLDSITAESADAVYFRYTNAVNSGKFQAVTRNNNTESASDTGVTVAANTWYDLEIIVNAAGTSVEFKINNISVGTIATNISTAAGRETGYGIFVLRSLGTVAVNALDADFIEVLYDFTTAR